MGFRRGFLFLRILGMIFVCTFGLAILKPLWDDFCFLSWKANPSWNIISGLRQQLCVSFFCFGRVGSIRKV